MVSMPPRAWKKTYSIAVSSVQTAMAEVSARVWLALRGA